MGKRHPNPRLAKIHRSYTVAEAAELYSVHRHTVREWIKRGLRTIDSRRPTLILGRDLGAFLEARRASNKRPCKPGEIYCVRCRTPKMPAGGMVDYTAVTETCGRLVGMCPDCNAMMYQRISLAKLGQIVAQMDIRLPQALRHIGESNQPCVNSDFGQGLSDHGKSQPRQ